MVIKNKFRLVFCIFLIATYSLVRGQKLTKSDTLFLDQTPLKVKFNYSNKVLNQKTNDSTFIKSKLVFFEKDQAKEIQISLRARGNFRRENCFITPVKMKIKKSQSSNTIFTGNKSLKLVLPCKNDRDKNDMILKEYVAYKIYEIISPFYFKTRRLEIDYADQRKKGQKNYNFKGFFIEDDDRVAKRFGGKIVQRSINPLAMDDFISVSLSFFNFMIGNTDFSSAHHHNGKLLYFEKKVIPIPYDFDLTGWVNPRYGKGVTNRLGFTFGKRNYIGFKREAAVYQKVRNHFLALKNKIFGVVARYESDFENDYAFTMMSNYLKEFYEILEDDKRYKNQIFSQAK